MRRSLAFLFLLLAVLTLHASGCRRAGRDRSEAVSVEVSGPAPMDLGRFESPSFYEAATDSELEAVFGDEHSETYIDAHPVPLAFQDEGGEVEELSPAQPARVDEASPGEVPGVEPPPVAEEEELDEEGSNGDAFPEPFWGLVVKVHDGDTIDVQKGEERWRVRLYGVDTPEKRQEYGPEARAFTKHLVGERIVEVRTKTVGPYGRLIAEVCLPGNVRLGRALVKSGCGWWYRRFARVDDAPEEGEPVSEGITLRDLEAEAKRERRGLWAAEKPQAPWDWRRKDKRKRSKKSKDRKKRSRG